jgi:hypothetical protein
MGLLRSGEKMTWKNWSTFASKVCSQIPELSLEGRFWYGELRLSRLNLIYRLRYMRFRGFQFDYKRYQTFFDSNFGWLLVIFIYVTVVLTAMQVVLIAASTNSILRRYHLTLLVDHRNERESHHKDQRLEQALRSVKDSSDHYGRASSMALTLTDSMAQAYPELKRPQRGRGRSEGEYQRRLKSLKNRISSGRNWNLM